MSLFTDANPAREGEAGNSLRFFHFINGSTEATVRAIHRSSAGVLRCAAVLAETGQYDDSVRQTMLIVLDELERYFKEYLDPTLDPSHEYWRPETVPNEVIELFSTQFQGSPVAAETAFNASRSETPEELRLSAAYFATATSLIMNRIFPPDSQAQSE
jgi:hypothetical protein